MIFIYPKKYFWGDEKMLLIEIEKKLRKKTRTGSFGRLLGMFSSF